MTEAAVSPEVLQRDLTEVAVAIDAARRTVEHGDFVDLGGLDERVGRLCSAIKLLPRDQGRGFERPLLGLVDELTRLTDELASQRDKVRQTLVGTSSHHQAASAYRKTQK